MRWPLICVSSLPCSACWSRSQTPSCRAVRRRTTAKWRKLKLDQARLEARQAKDWAAADAARNRLTEMGIILEDGPQGTTWRRK